MSRGALSVHFVAKVAAVLCLSLRVCVSVCLSVRVCVCVCNTTIVATLAEVCHPNPLTLTLIANPYP